MIREQLRDISRRKKDLLSAADSLEMARRNSMTLDNLRDRLKALEAGFREKAQMLQEQGEDIIDDAKAVTTAANATPPKSKEKVH